MLNTHKLLYILPDLAYIAELLPAKKPHTFAIQSFRQINGQFMDENVFNTVNIEKLFEKLEPEEYRLILPDSMFTNTILTVNETDDKKIIDQLINTTLPKLGLTKSTHEIETSVLAQLNNNAKVQVSALEKSLLAPIRIMANKYKVQISSISPVTWTVKSVVSLEPSISVLQIGAYLYTALHYIGVDQATLTLATDVDQVAETIKTLKGTEPNIQTIYLLASNQIEDKLKTLLSDTVPLQQLTNIKDDQAKMPGFVKQIIESGMRTLSIDEYPVPQFKLGSISTQDQEDLVYQANSFNNEASTSQETQSMSDLPKPNDASQEEKSTPVVAPTPEVSVESVGETTDQIKPTKSGVKFESTAKLDNKLDIEAKLNKTLEKKEVSPTVGSAMGKAKPEETPKANIDLTRFTSSTSDNSHQEKPSLKPQLTSATQIQKPASTKSTGVNTMLRMLFITVAVFFATVAIGVGVGLAILNFTNSQATPPETPVVITDDAQTPGETEPTIAPTPIEVDRTTVSILVVNATTKAGYASTTKTKLETADYKSVVAGNAKGDYEAGVYVLMAEESVGLVQALSKDSELELVFAEGYSTEDSLSKYSAVIVLAE